MFSRDPSACAVTAAELGRALGLPIRATATAREAVVGSDIVITCTTSKEPVVHGTWIDQGCTVVSVGSFAPGHREADTALLTRAAAVVVDDVATAREQAGPVIAALRDGDLEP
jgi:ornithine cyclodeaminase